MFWFKLVFCLILTALFVIKLVYEDDKKETGLIALLYIVFIAIVSSGNFF